MDQPLLLLIFCWALDRVVHEVYVIVCFLAKGGVGKKERRHNDNKSNGRHDFQIDLGIALINYGISTEWKDISQIRPNFIRQTALYPVTVINTFFA